MTEDENDDPVLRSMRSVWVSMRDEDPPASGLSELLAAARVKAEAMKPAPWWRRMFAVMVRPPMLAAATVVVLVGGGIVISQRSGDHEPARADVVVPTEQPVVADKGKDVASEPEKRDQTVTIDPVTPELTVEQPPRRTAPRPRPPRRVVEETPKPEGAGEVGGVIESPPPPPPPPPDNKPSGAGEDRLEIATGNIEPTTTTRAPQIDQGRDRDQSQPPVDQLVKQAEVAAIRKDCPAVRVTVKRIQQLDKGARDRVAKQPAVANCLK